MKKINAKKIIFSVIILSVNLIMLFNVSLNVSAQGVPSSWAQEEVNSAINLGLVPSEIQNNYQKNISRENFCKLIVKMFEVYSQKTIDEILENNNSLNFNNPFKEKNLCKEIIACYKFGIVNGDESGYFRPNDNITRQEAAKILTETANIFGKLEDQSLIDFEDKTDIGKWAEEYVDFVVLKGIMNGVKAQQHIYFKPKNGYTTEQAILTIYRLYKNVIRFDDNLVGNVDNFITNKLEGLSNELKIYNFEFEDEMQKYNFVDVNIAQKDSEFKIEMIDKNNKAAEINVIGKYVMLASCELDGNEEESELYLKYLDINENEYIKILKYEGDHIDTLITLANVNYFDNEVKGDGNGRIYGPFHTLSDGTVNGYYDINEDYKIERVINKDITIKTNVKTNMVGAVALIDGKEIVITNELKNEYGLNIGDEVTISNIYKYKNYVTITTKTNAVLQIVVTK